MQPVTPLRRLLHLQQSLFPLDTPAIAAHAAVSTNHAMARDGNGNGISGASSGNRADSARSADSLCNLAVGLRRPKRNRLQICPHPSLKSRGADVEWQR